MANYDSLINAVKAAVKTNGTGAITGATLQATLLGTIEELTVGFQFMGVATPETTPDSDDKKEFYLGFAGTYANFGSSVTVPEGSVILFKKNNGAWSSQVVKIADPVSVSQNTSTGDTDVNIGIESHPVASTRQIKEIDFELGKNIVKTVSGYYLDTTGNLVATASGGSKYTDIMLCQQGDIFVYRGRGYGDMAAYILWNGDTLVSYGQCTQDRIERLTITIPSDVNGIQFASYSSGTVTLEIIKEQTKPFADYVNGLFSPKAPTESIKQNKVIKKLFIDTSNYTGSYSLSKLALNNFNVGVLIGSKYYWDFAIVNEQGDTIITNKWRQYANQNFPSDVYEYTANGIYVYVEYDWESAKEFLGQDVAEYHKYINPCCYASINDARRERNAEINPLYGKKVGWAGDSICEGAGYAGGYASIIAARNNMTSQNIGVSGGTIAETADETRHCISSTITNLDSDCDYIIMEGGVNDLSLNVPLGAIRTNFGGFTTTQFYGALEMMFRRVYEKYPGKKIGFILVHNAAVTDTDSFSEQFQSPYVMAIIEVCKKWGVSICDLNTSVPPMKLFSSGSDLKTNITQVYTYNGDGTHPNEQGYLKYYCDKIEAWMKTL